MNEPPHNGMALSSFTTSIYNSPGSIHLTFDYLVHLFRALDIQLFSSVPDKMPLDLMSAMMAPKSL